jgi:hypothetical protein
VSLNLLEPSGPVQSVMGLLYFFTYTINDNGYNQELSLIQETMNNKSDKNRRREVTGTPFEIRRKEHLEETKLYKTSMYKGERKTFSDTVR